MEEERIIQTGEVPAEVKKWNWGAFMFNIMWGIGNKTYLPLLCFIPIFNIVWIFVCGAKGNEWAWKDGEYSSVEEFMKVQNTWNRAGVVSFIFSIVGVALMIVMYSILIAAVMQLGSIY